VGKQSSKFPAERKRSSVRINAAINGGTHISIKSTEKPHTISCASFAKRRSRYTVIPDENTVATSATLRIGSEEQGMGNREDKNELIFLMTMSSAKKMMLEGLITQEEYRKFDTIMQQKYRPKYGALFSDITLI
jgi:hypothetical protein